MNHLKILSAILFFFGLQGCEPPVTFTEPQPIGVKNLAKFPKHIQGKYVSLEDSSTLVISDRLIERMYDFKEALHINQLDSNTRLSGDTITHVITNEKLPFTRVGDSLLTNIHWVDTVFLLNYDNVVRKYKGYYFINIRFNEAKWEVKKMHLAKGELVLSSVTSTQDIENLQEITQTQQDTVPPYTFTVSKKQFKKFVKKGGFEEGETFVKLKK